MKCWYPYTKKLKYFSSATFDEHNNNFGKIWSPGSNLLNVIDTSNITKIKIYLSNNPFIKDDIFEATVTFPPRGTPIYTITYYYYHHIITYIYQSKNNNTWKRSFTTIQRTNICVLIIGIKHPTTLQQVI